MTYPASIRLVESLQDGVKACKALASLMQGCCSDFLFCSKIVANHCLPISDGEPHDVLLHHLFGGLCIMQPNVPVFGEISRGYKTHVQVSYKLCSLLSFAYTHNDVRLNIFHLCCTSIGLDASKYERQLVGKLSIKLKARDPLNGCQDIFDALSQNLLLSDRP